MVAHALLPAHSHTHTRARNGTQRKPHAPPPDRLSLPQRECTLAGSSGSVVAMWRTAPCSAHGSSGEEPREAKEGSGGAAAPGEQSVGLAAPTRLSRWVWVICTRCGLGCMTPHMHARTRTRHRHAHTLAHPPTNTSIHVHTDTRSPVWPIRWTRLRRTVSAVTCRALVRSRLPG